MDETKIEAIVKKELSERRFSHVVGVVGLADELARKFGADPKKARIAAWIHDYVKEWPAEKLIRIARESGVSAEYFQIIDILHGQVSAEIMPDVFGIVDEEIRMAVRSHTTGRAGMTLLEKVVYLADAIEPGRNYAGVEKIREFARTDLDRAIAEQLDDTIRYLLDHHRPIFVKTLEARNDFWQKVLGKAPDRRELT